jgi:hypothetical protein
MRIATTLTISALCAAATATAATQLQVHFSALERALAAQMFTAEGRMFLKGTQKSKCSFAFLQDPKLSGGEGRLLIHARFSGKSARSFFGKCVGWGDSFDVIISGTPRFEDGVVRLRDVHVDAKGRDSMYVRRVRRALAESLAKDFKYRLADDARRMVADMKMPGPFAPQILDFHIAGIAVTPAAVVLTVDFQMAVR